MPILPDPKHEVFAQEVAKGRSAVDAFEAAGYKRHASNASRMIRNDNIRDRVTEIQSAACAEVGVTVEKIVLEYAKIAFADVTEAVEWGEALPTQIPDTDEFVLIQGVRMKASDKLPRRVTAAISEVKQTKDGLSIKFHSKQSALDSLGKHLGMFKEQVEVNSSQTLEQLVLGAMELKKQREAQAAAEAAQEQRQSLN